MFPCVTFPFVTFLFVMFPCATFPFVTVIILHVILIKLAINPLSVRPVSLPTYFERALHPAFRQLLERFTAVSATPFLEAPVAFVPFGNHLHASFFMPVTSGLPLKLL